MHLCCVQLIFDQNKYESYNNSDTGRMKRNPKRLSCSMSAIFRKSGKIIRKKSPLRANFVRSQTSFVIVNVRSYFQSSKRTQKIKKK
jgi:hypothetical protein